MTEIRTATRSDAASLAELAERTFRDTFAPHNRNEDMQSYCDAAFGVGIQQREIASSDHITLVAADHGQLAGYAQMRWGEAPSCVAASAPTEIRRLYVDQAWHGKGLSHELMSACLAVMGERNTDLAWLGVWEHNPRAIAFYRKFDFHEAGAHRFLLGSDPQRDIILVRSL